jgi:hypothetical protein
METFENLWPRRRKEEKGGERRALSGKAGSKKSNRNLIEWFLVGFSGRLLSSIICKIFSLEGLLKGC